tara:strand:+ start:1405 stop:1623 length:219 start_codon:yes stop_codon:yes gene_type:complete
MVRITYPPTTWRRVKTVKNPVDINIIVATTDLPEALETPHTPWPLVQPLPKTDPKPTKRPAKPRRTKLLDTD